MRRHWLLCFAASAVVAAYASAADLRNTQKFLFVADRKEPIFDVISMSSRALVHRIGGRRVADQIVVSPYAPVLAYANVASRTLFIMDISKDELLAEIGLSVVPRHMVLNTAGTHVGVTDSEEGGFVYVNLYAQEIEFELSDFPSTGDVLFDPNEIYAYYMDATAGAFGIIDLEQHNHAKRDLFDGDAQSLLSPSRSLDGRYLYIADQESGIVYGLNAFSKAVFRTFTVGDAPTRPYTTPEGHFVYLIDKATGRFASYDQFQFEKYADVELGPGIDLVATGRFDRMNLFVSSTGTSWFLFDNVAQEVIRRGEFQDVPVDVLAAADGKTAYLAFRASPQVAMFDLENGAIEMIPATRNGSGAFTLGLSNNVCH